MLDRCGAVPLYHQIYLQLRDEILSGERGYGSAMPTEQELSDHYNVSRITARRVLNDLAEQHYVERKRRVGTRVIFKSPSRPIEANIEQAVDSLLAFGEGTKVDVVSIERRAASARVATSLRLETGAPVIRTVRIRSLDDVPIGYVLSYVPAALEKFVNRKALSKTPILKVLAQAGYRARHAEQTINAILADGEMVGALEVQPMSAILRITRTVFDEHELPFLLTYAHYRADRFHLRLDLQASPAE